MSRDVVRGWYKLSFGANGVLERLISLVHLFLRPVPALGQLLEDSEHRVPGVPFQQERRVSLLLTAARLNHQTVLANGLTGLEVTLEGITQQVQELRLEIISPGQEQGLHPFPEPPGALVCRAGFVYYWASLDRFVSHLCKPLKIRLLSRQSRKLPFLKSDQKFVKARALVLKPSRSGDPFPYPSQPTTHSFATTYKHPTTLQVTWNPARVTGCPASLVPMSGTCPVCYQQTLEGCHQSPLVTSRFATFLHAIDPLILIV